MVWEHSEGDRQFLERLLCLFNLVYHLVSSLTGLHSLSVIFFDGEELASRDLHRGSNVIWNGGGVGHACACRVASQLATAVTSFSSSGESRC